MNIKNNNKKVIDFFTKYIGIKSVLINGYKFSDIKITDIEIIDNNVVTMVIDNICINNSFDMNIKDKNFLESAFLEPYLNIIFEKNKKFVEVREAHYIHSSSKIIFTIKENTTFFKNI